MQIRISQYIRRSLPVLVAVAVLFAGVLAGQTPPEDLREYIKANYTKRELMIPMRDGVNLFTTIYEPKNAAQKYPILLTRTPFSVAPYGKDAFRPSLGPDDLFAREGYIFAYQDVRGLWASEGEFVHLRPAKTSAGATDETTDAYDTVDWLVKNVANNNGRVGIYGTSYPGFYTSAAIIDTHPAIKAASPQAPIADCFMGDDFHHNGAPFLAQNFSFYNFFNDRKRLVPNDFSAFQPFDFETEDGYAFFLKLGGLKNAGDYYEKTLGRRSTFWDEVAAHPNYDKYWNDRNILPRLKNIRTPVMVVGGWYDNEDLYGALETYRSIKKQNPAVATVLVVGPWAHNTWARVDGDWLGTAYFGSKTAAEYREKFELPFFNYHLKGKGDISDIKPVNVFDTGTNSWRTFEGIDPAAAVPTAVYLAAGGRLTIAEPPGESGIDRYVSDPMDPVPFTQKKSMDYPQEFMTEDQRFAAKRKDVLVYQSDVLTEDTTVAGDIMPQLFASTSGTDSDFIVKLIDVFPSDFHYPDGVRPPDGAAGRGFMPSGYQMLLRGEPFPARFRNGFDHPTPMKPDVPAAISFVMPGVTHTFKKGHRIMLQIQSTWFPLVARNPQTFVPNINVATDHDFQKTTQRVLYGGRTASKVVLPIIRNRSSRQTKGPKR